MANTIISCNYSLAGNGKKLTKLANGWLVAIARNSSTLQCYVSQDDGVSWTSLCSISSVDASPAIVSIGNICYVFYIYNNTVYCNKFDATTQTNVNISADKTVVETVTSLNTGVSAAVDIDTGIIYVAYSAKTVDYPDAFNIRYSYSSDGVTWAGVQLTTTTDSSQRYQNPFMLIHNSIPFIMFCEYSSSYYGIEWGYDGSFGLMTYVLSTTLLDNFTAVIDNSGIATLFCSFSDGAGHDRINYQSYDLATASHISHGSYDPNGYNQKRVSAEIAGNTIYLYFEGIDPLVSTSRTLIRCIAITNGTWNAVTNVEKSMSYNDTYVKTFLLSNKIYFIWNESSAGIKSDVFVFDSFPNAPTNLLVANFDASDSSLFSWDYYSETGNPQSVFRLQILAINTGSIVFDTGKVSGSISSYTMAANTLTNGSQYLWKVSVWDSLDVAGPDSGLATVYVFAKPTVTIDVPTNDNDVYGLPRLAAKWTYHDSAGKAQEAYQVKLLNSDDNLLFDTGKILDINATIKDLSYSMDDGAVYKVKVTVWNIYDIKGSEVTRIFSTNFTAPPKPVLTITNVKDSLQLAWTTPAPTGGQPNIAYYRIWKGETPLASLYKDNIAQSPFIDYQVGNGILYQYLLEAVSTTGSKTLSSAVTGIAQFNNLYIVDTNTGASAQLVAGLEYDNASLDRARTELQPLYSSYPTVVYGSKKARKGSVKATIIPSDGQTPLAAYRVFEQLVNGDIKIPLTMKKSNGEIYIVDIYNLTEKEERVSKYKNCAFEFVEVGGLPWS